MPIFNISIVDSVETGTATEEHASMDAARASVIQSALRILHSGRTVQGKRVAECEIADVVSSREAHFTVTVEITDQI